MALSLTPKRRPTQSTQTQRVCSSLDQRQQAGHRKDNDGNTEEEGEGRSEGVILSLSLSLSLSHVLFSVFIESCFCFFSFSLVIYNSFPLNDTLIRNNNNNNTLTAAVIFN